MSDTSSEENQLKEEIAFRYYEKLKEFECPTNVEYLRRCHCLTRTQRKYINSQLLGERFSDFLQEFPHLFFVENGMVAQYDDSLDYQRQQAVEYFEEILKNSLRPVGIVNLRRHIGLAYDCVIKFINTFYPGEEFSHFLQSSDVFVVYGNDAAWSTYNECVQFYESLLRNMGQGIYYYHLLMNSSLASSQIKAFLQNNYPGEQFRAFLEENPDYFQVDENGFVNFRENETDNSEDNYCDSVYSQNDDDSCSDQLSVREAAAEFFHAKIKSSSYYPHYMKLLDFIYQATRRVKIYINANYPGESFKSFLLSQPHYFIVQADDTVRLTDEECVSFLKNRLRTLAGSLHHTTLLFHVGLAHRNIRDYMSYYDYNTSFREFLQNYPGVFNLDAYGFVSLHDEEPITSCSDDIETSAAEYFEQFLIGTDSPHYMNFRGHLGQASEDVVDYIKQCYPGRAFMSFLLNQPNFFIVDRYGIVCSTKNKCIRYFEDILEESGGEIYWYNLQMHLLRAGRCIKAFFRNKYPGEKFRKFFQDYQHVFRIDSDGLVSSISEWHFENAF